MAQAFEHKGQQYGGEEFIRRLEKEGQLPTPEELEKSEDPRFKHLRHNPQTKGYTVKPFEGEFRHPDPAAKHPAPYSALTPSAHAVHREPPKNKEGGGFITPARTRWDEHLERAGLQDATFGAQDANEFESAQRKFFKTERYDADGHPVPKKAMLSPYSTRIWEKHERTERLDSNINAEKLEKLEKSVEKAEKASNISAEKLENLEKSLEKAEKAEKAKENDKEGGLLSKIFGKGQEKTEKTEKTPETTPEKTPRTPEQ